MSGLQYNTPKTDLNRVLLLYVEVCIEQQQQQQKINTLSKSSFISFSCQTQNIPDYTYICGFGEGKLNLTWHKLGLAVFLKVSGIHAC